MCRICLPRLEAKIKGRQIALLGAVAATKEKAPPNVSGAGLRIDDDVGPYE
jgi:hypothetical protein